MRNLIALALATVVAACSHAPRGCDTQTIKTAYYDPATHAMNIEIAENNRLFETYARALLYQPGDAVYVCYGRYGEAQIRRARDGSPWRQFAEQHFIRV